MSRSSANQSLQFNKKVLDFIINYDITYRMGAEAEGEEGHAPQ
jgi:hypothetical protein